MGNMTPRDWFGLVVRSLGIWSVYQGAQNLLYFTDVRLGLSTMRDVLGRTTDSSPVSYLYYAVGYSLLGAWFLVWTDDIVRFSYRKQTIMQSGEASPNDARDVAD